MLYFLELKQRQNLPTEESIPFKLLNDRQRCSCILLNQIRYISPKYRTEACIQLHCILLKGICGFQSNLAFVNSYIKNKEVKMLSQTCFVQLKQYVQNIY